MWSLQHAWHDGIRPKRVFTQHDIITHKRTRSAASTCSQLCTFSTLCTGSKDLNAPNDRASVLATTGSSSMPVQVATYTEGWARMRGLS